MWERGSEDLALGMLVPGRGMVAQGMVLPLPDVFHCMGPPRTPTPSLSSSNGAGSGWLSPRCQPRAKVPAWPPGSPSTGLGDGEEKHQPHPTIQLHG